MGRGIPKIASTTMRCSNAKDRTNWREILSSFWRSARIGPVPKAHEPYAKIAALPEKRNLRVEKHDRHLAAQ
jgi:hypothetical protein